MAPAARPAPDGNARAATLTWLALVALTLVSVLAAARGQGPDTRLLMAWAVAALCALKGELLVRHYLHARAAGPVFERLIRGFAALAPLALLVSALRERLLG